MRIQLPAIWIKKYDGTKPPSPTLYSVYSDIDMAREAFQAIYNDYNTYNNLGDSNEFFFYDEEGHNNMCYLDYVEFNKLN